MSKSGPIEWMIGPATLADAPAILALQHRAYQSEAALYNDGTIPPLRQTLDELLAEFGKVMVLKAEVPDQLVGSVRAHLVGDTAHIGRLIVEPARQGRGIGSALLRAIECALPASRYELFTGSRSATNIRLYQRHGYAIYRRSPMPGANQAELVFMAKLNVPDSPDINARAAAS
ncbi:MAG TPA: GNAT family N-acetyltransferase [Chitinolyticbacter sp.]|nr:GNAT family N-acetyltransferase [Chitinolyticbacter sp.]